MKVIFNIRQALVRTLFILLSMPAVTWAWVKIDNTLTIDQNPISKIILFDRNF